MVSERGCADPGTNLRRRWMLHSTWTPRRWRREWLRPCVGKDWCRWLWPPACVSEENDPSPNANKDSGPRLIPATRVLRGSPSRRCGSVSIVCGKPRSKHFANNSNPCGSRTVRCRKTSPPLSGISEIWVASLTTTTSSRDFCASSYVTIPLHSTKSTQITEIITTIQSQITRAFGIQSSRVEVGIERSNLDWNLEEDRLRNQRTELGVGEESRRRRRKRGIAFCCLIHRCPFLLLLAAFVVFCLIQMLEACTHLTWNMKLRRLQEKWPQLACGAYKYHLPLALQ